MWAWLEQREMSRRARRSTAKPAGPRPRPDRPAGTDLIPEIRHIVVLMMENHSYDSYLGMLTGRGEGFALGSDGTPEVSNLGSDGKPVRAHNRASTRQFPDVPCQSWYASHRQWNAGANDGFARTVSETVPGGDEAEAMRYWTEGELPFYHSLARTFPLADRWFCSCLGPTFPNRRFLIAGTANGLIDDLPFDIVDYPAAGTIFDSLSRHGISWVNYHNVTHYRVLARRAFGGGGLTAARRLASLGSWYPPLARAVRGNKSFTADVFPLGIARCVLHLRNTQRFFEDADNGTLPSVSIVDPDFSLYSEENPQDISYGESFAAEVINRVMHGRGWPHTLLIWFYDEHGGYYDHVPPPPAPRPDDIDGRPIKGLPGWLQAVLRPLAGGTLARDAAADRGPHRYDRYGFRVPAVIVSPYARREFVSSQVFDHTSVLKLIEEKWNLAPLTRRDAEAVSPLGMVDLAAPPAFLTPPDLAPPKLAWTAWRNARPD